MRLRHVRSVPPPLVWARCSALARSAVSPLVGLVVPRHNRRDTTPAQIQRATRRVATLLLLVSSFALVTATAANAATHTAVKSTGPVVVRVQLRRPGVYEVRVTVTSAAKNRVNLAIGSLQGHIAKATVVTSRGHQIMISRAVRVAGTSLMIRATGGQSQPTLKVLKWLLAPIHTGQPSLTIKPTTPSKPKALTGPSTSPKPTAKVKPHGQPTTPPSGPPAAAVVVKRILQPGIYAVHVALSSHTSMRNRIKVKIGSVERYATTSGNRRSARVSVRIAVTAASITVRAFGRRKRPTLGVSIRRLTPLATALPTGGGSQGTASPTTAAPGTSSAPTASSTPTGSTAATSSTAPTLFSTVTTPPTSTTTTTTTTPKTPTTPTPKTPKPPTTTPTGSTGQTSSTSPTLFNPPPTPTPTPTPTPHRLRLRHRRRRPFPRRLPPRWVRWVWVGVGSWCLMMSSAGRRWIRRSGRRAGSVAG